MSPLIVVSNHQQPATNKLEQQKTMLMNVQSKLDKYHALSTDMSLILTNFDTRLEKLELTILPVYNETEHLQRRQHNLDSTLLCLDNVLSHYDASQEVCNLIHLGPNEHDIGTFLEALEKLKRAQEYFLSNNTQSVELENVTSLLNVGCETLNNHFRFLLKKHCTPLKPVDLLDLIYVEEDTSNDDCPSIKQLPPTAREELQVISNWLDQNLRREYVNIYSAERSDVVFRSLSMLKDHQRSGSWGAEPLKRGATAAGYYSKGEQRKSTSARLQQIFERKANKMLQKASQTIEQSRFALKKSADNLASDDYLGDGNQELEKYLVLLLGLQRLLIWERQILMDVVPSGRVVEVFSRLAQPSIDMVVRDVENITAKVMRSIGRKEWTAALGIFSALKDVIILQPDIDKVCDASQSAQLGVVVSKLQQTGTKALEQFLELVRNEVGGNLVGMSSSTIGISSVPRDATVHELTSNTIWFLEHLCDHWDVIGSILQTDPAYSNQLESLQKTFSSAEEKKRALLGIYYKKAISELNLTIVSKCEQYGDLATRHLFRLNNIHYILKSLQRTNLLDVICLAEPECESNYQQLIRELKKSYQKTWSKLLANVGALDELPRPPSSSGKLKDKERAAIKDRFAAFNKDLEEACKVQRGLSVPDILLREGLKRDNAENIVPKYNSFFEMYAEVQFSKNPEKYIKYRPEDLSNCLNSLFDDTV